MQKASNLLGGLTGLMTMTDGTCAEHGPAKVLAHRGIWHCPECVDQAHAAAELARAQAARREDMMRAAAIPSKFQGQRFNDVTDEQKSVRALARAFLDMAVIPRVWGVLVLAGETGNGKTLLACEVAQSLFNGKLMRSVRYTTAKGMISEIQSCYGRDDRTEEGQMARFVQPDVLIIDEIDGAPSTPNAAKLMNEVVNQRYGDQKAVIVITNQPFADLSEFVGSRVYSRLNENSFVCAFTGPDQRMVA